MKAIVQDRFGPPEILRLADTGVPEVGAGDVLVRVHAQGLFKVGVTVSDRVAGSFWGIGAA